MLVSKQYSIVGLRGQNNYKITHKDSQLLAYHNKSKYLKMKHNNSVHFPEMQFLLQMGLERKQTSLWHINGSLIDQLTYQLVKHKI